MNLNSAFRSVFERNPTVEETNRFHRLAKELDIRDNDAIWAVTFLLGYHLEIAKDMPQRMQEHVAESLKKYRAETYRMRAAAEMEMIAAKTRIEENVSASVVRSAKAEIAKAAQAVARDVARKSWLQWLGAACVSGMLLAAGIFYWGYVKGNEAGYVRSQTAQAASTWGASPAGQAAYKLDQNGDLTSIVRCKHDGWRIRSSEDGKHKLCVVGPDADGETIGWFLP